MRRELFSMASTVIPDFSSFDHLATLVAVTRPDGQCVFANAAFEDLLGLPRRILLQHNALDWFVQRQTLQATVDSVLRNEFRSGRFDAALRRPGAGPWQDPLPVHVIITRIERTELVLIEGVEISQQARQEREARTLDQVRVSKELVRNLAHEIKNPLGGIRGAAQLLELDLTDKSLIEYTQVIVHEADRLQALVDRLLAPHRRPHVVADVNIHEVLERVRSLVLVEYSRGLQIVRDYDASLPEFRGDREQLIQAVLNITQNAAQALAQRRQDSGDARIIFRTRVARQVTIGLQRYRLALELHIEDNGPGVAAEIRDRIFFPLVSGRDGGSGLGLTLAQDFIQQHQGTIECESEPGRTLFRILIPLP